MVLLRGVEENRPVILVNAVEPRSQVNQGHHAALVTVHAGDHQWSHAFKVPEVEVCTVCTQVPVTKLTSSYFSFTIISFHRLT